MRFTLDKVGGEAKAGIVWNMPDKGKVKISVREMLKRQCKRSKFSQDQNDHLTVLHHL